MAEATTNSDPTPALRELAANRGFRLVKSRRRKPGGDFGRYGLADAKTGKEMFGFGRNGLQASADEIADFLRERTISTWESSLGALGKTKPEKAPARSNPSPENARRARAKVRERKPRKSAPAPTPAPPSPRAVSPAPPPPLRIRTADAVDGEALAPLLADLGFEAGADALADRIGGLSRMGEPVLVAKIGDALAGCITWHVTNMLHRPHPVGRITLLIVAPGMRRKGVGRALVEAAEARLTARGCGLVEVTSNDKRRAAHAFYRRLGYEQTSRRFAKPIGSGKRS